MLNKLTFLLCLLVFGLNVLAVKLVDLSVCGEFIDFDRLKMD